MKYKRLLITLFALAIPLLADDLKEEVWHIHKGYGNVSLLITDYSKIQKIKIGMSFDELAHEIGSKPCRIASNPEIALYMTEISGAKYEVAILDKNEGRVLSVSFRKMKEPNKALQTTTMAVTDAAAQPPRQP